MLTDYRIRIFNLGPYNDVIEEIKKSLEKHCQFIFDEHDDAGVIIRFRCECLEVEQLNDVVKGAWGILKGFHRIAIQRRPVPPKGDILIYNSSFFKGQSLSPEFREPKQRETPNANVQA